MLNQNESNKKVFKTSLKHVGITTSKNIVRFIKRIPGNNLTLNKETNIGKYMNSRDGPKNLKNFTNKNNLNGRKLIRFDEFNNEKSSLEQKISIKNSNKKINSKSFKETLPNDSLFYQKIKNFPKFFPQTNKNKLTVNNVISLKNWNSRSAKNISLPKKIKFKGSSKKAFSFFTGMPFNDKEVNVWENTNIFKVSVKTSFLLNKIGNSYNQESKSFRNCYSLKKLIKYPLIYIPNFNK